jgi:glutathione peroxidase
VLQSWVVPLSTLLPKVATLVASFAFAKQVVSGDEAHPFYRWARDTLGFGTAPKWNFHKYLIARDGTLVDYFNSTTAPDASRLVKAIEAELAKPAAVKP